MNNGYNESSQFYPYYDMWDWSMMGYPYMDDFMDDDFDIGGDSSTSQFMGFRPFHRRRFFPFFPFFGFRFFPFFPFFPFHHRRF